MCPHRIVLGIVTGEAMNETRVTGQEWPEPRERFRRLSEATKLIRRLWTEDFVEHDGEYYHVRGATVYDRPAEPVPIYVAATGEEAARFAGRLGHGVILPSGKRLELSPGKLLP